MYKEQIQTKDLKEVIFGDRCYWCFRKEPCDCHDLPSDLQLSQTEYDAKCKCTCGRCCFDDGNRPNLP